MSHLSTSALRLPIPTERLLEQVRLSLLGIVFTGWQRVEIKYNASASLNQTRIVIRTADGRTPAAYAPAGLDETLTAIRKVMYEPGRGTWFSAKLTLTPPEELCVEFNFDDDPEWWPSVSAALFERDSEVFPRDEEHVPRWLTEVLAGAEEEQRQWDGEAAAEEVEVKTAVSGEQDAIASFATHLTAEEQERARWLRSD